MKGNCQKKRSGRRIRGQSVLESLLCMIVLCLILFGFLQIFNIAIAKMLTEYSAYRAARSYAVGFRSHLISRSSNVAAIGASGRITEPDSFEYGSPMEQFAQEELMIPEYLAGTNRLNYEFWSGGNDYDRAFYAADVQPPSTTLGYTSYETGSGTVNLDVSFTDYPFVFFDLMDKDRVWFDSVGTGRSVSGVAELGNHAGDYLTGEQ